MRTPRRTKLAAAGAVAAFVIVFGAVALVGIFSDAFDAGQSAEERGELFGTIGFVLAGGAAVGTFFLVERSGR
jgi:hypothetical protein